jgi:hypothetical protein
VNDTALAVVFITLLSVVSCACFLLILRTAPDNRSDHEAPPPLVDEGQSTTSNLSVVKNPRSPLVDRAGEKRNVAVTFTGFLIGLAYQEAVRPVRVVLESGDFTTVTAALVTTFFVLGLSTFFGAYFHFLVAPWTGLDWVWNFLVVVVSAVFLVFMGGVCTEKASTDNAPWGMFRWVLAYNALMVVWALAILGRLMWSRQMIGASTRRSIAYTVVPALLVVVIFFAFSDRYATVPALLLAAVSIVHFGLDLRILIRVGMV